MRVPKASRSCKRPRIPVSAMADAANTPSEGVREKLRRAHMHRAEFEARLATFIEGGPYSSIRRDDVESGRRRWVFHVNAHPPQAEFGALIGDCLFNFRSALDHFAYDLAVAFSGSPLDPEVEKNSAFPIFWEHAPKAATLRKKIGAVHPDAQRLIEGMQPYDHTGRAALGLLEQLHNFDKHRTLHLLGAATTSATHWGDEPFKTLNLGPLEDGDELASGPIPDSPDRDQDLQFSFGVAFSGDGPGSGYEVSLALSWIGQHIERQVLDPLLPYLAVA